MSLKTQDESSTPTQSVNTVTKKIQAMLLPLDSDTTAYAPVVMQLDPSASLADDPYESPEFQLAWDNQVKFHVSRNLLHLRRFRRESQAQVAKAVGSSQSAIARIESGDENVTLETVERITRHLNGRFRVSIAPAEFSTTARRLWWDELESQLAPAAPPVQAQWYSLTVAVELPQAPNAVMVGVTSPSVQALYRQTHSKKD